MREFIGHRIALRMRTLRLTQKQLATKANLSESSISNYIAGTRTPNAKSLKRIAEALYISTDYLLYGTNIDNYTKIEKLLKESVHNMSEQQKKQLMDILLQSDTEQSERM